MGCLSLGFAAVAVFYGDGFIWQVCQTTETQMVKE